MPDDAADRANGLKALLNRDPHGSFRVEKCRREAAAVVATLCEEDIAMLQQMIAGWSVAESAAELGFGLPQAHQKRADLLAKLNAKSTADAIRVGIYAGLG